MRSRLKAFGAFWYDFIIGDDWTAAAGIAITLIITGVVATLAVPAWRVAPTAIALLLHLSLWRATRQP